MTEEEREIETKRIEERMFWDDYWDRNDGSRFVRKPPGVASPDPPDDPEAICNDDEIIPCTSPVDCDDVPF